MVSEEKGEAKKKTIKRECNSLILSNNSLTSFSGLGAILANVMYSSENLRKACVDGVEWLDLSFNQIKNIDRGISCFSQLKILYLHCNAITSLREVKNLAKLKELRHVTLYGNPISKAQHYRSYCIGIISFLSIAMLPQIFKFDSIMITKKEIVSSVVVYDYFCEKKIATKHVTALQERWDERQRKRLGMKKEQKPKEKSEVQH